jgi:hypothetical protein
VGRLGVATVVGVGMVREQWQWQKWGFPLQLSDEQCTCYAWDNDLSPEFPSSVGVGQGSALAPILLALCLAPLLKEFEHRVCVAVLISYVDDGTIIVQSDTWDKNLVKLKLG